MILRPKGHSGDAICGFLVALMISFFLFTVVNMFIFFWKEAFALAVERRQGTSRSGPDHEDDSGPSIQG
jgi:hypothetical protein